MKTYSVRVREGHEYATFFVEEEEVVQADSGPRYAATWTCYSSFGVYGHYWSNMGSRPFAQFIQGVQPDYLLGKIADGKPKQQAKAFCNRLWPKFVEAMRDRQEAA